MKVRYSSNLLLEYFVKDTEKADKKIQVKILLFLMKNEIVVWVFFGVK